MHFTQRSQSYNHCDLCLCAIFWSRISHCSWRQF